MSRSLRLGPRLPSPEEPDHHRAVRDHGGGGAGAEDDHLRRGAPLAEPRTRREAPQEVEAMSRQEYLVKAAKRRVEARRLAVEGLSLQEIGGAWRVPRSR